MMRFVLVIPLLVMAAAASAQQKMGHDACARDVSRFCRSVMNNGDQVVLACLQQHRGQISRACNKIMAEHGQ
jgi:cysteine rich repeat protein